MFLCVYRALRQTTCRWVYGNRKQLETGSENWKLKMETNGNAISQLLQCQQNSHVVGFYSQASQSSPCLCFLTTCFTSLVSLSPLLFPCSNSVFGGDQYPSGCVNRAWVWSHHLLHILQTIKTGSGGRSMDEQQEQKHWPCSKTKSNCSHDQIVALLVPRPSHM